MKSVVYSEYWILRREASKAVEAGRNCELNSHYAPAYHHYRQAKLMDESSRRLFGKSLGLGIDLVSIISRIKPLASAELYERSKILLDSGRLEEAYENARESCDLYGLSLYFDNRSDIACRIINQLLDRVRTEIEDGNLGQAFHLLEKTRRYGGFEPSEVPEYSHILNELPRWHINMAQKYETMGDFRRAEYHYNKSIIIKTSKQAEDGLNRMRRLINKQYRAKIKRDLDSERFHNL